MHSPARRRFLSTIAVAAAAGVLPLRAAGAAAGSVPISRAHFPQSVASGDPRPDRVLLWTRLAAAAAQLRLQVAEDPGFARLRVDRMLQPPRDSDGCLKVRVENLQPATVYHYRFLLDDGHGGQVSSPTGRTRTAPAADTDVPVELAFVSCQDYGGRWYNTLLPLLDRELDLVLHLGDFIYETTGDPQFQDQAGERTIALDDIDGAIALERGGRRYYAARSLANYRQLHRTFRSDPVLQALLERTPLVAIWDDHEFSDDCWQDVGTYHDGAADERDRQRRRNAEQAYFEYLPVDLELADATGARQAAQLPVQRERLFPNVQLWRRLRFGKALDLLLTDYRSQRPDHAIPEDAFPGALAYDQPQLQALLPRLGLEPAAVLPTLIPYVELAAPTLQAQRRAAQHAITQAYLAAGQSPAQAERRAAQATASAIALPVLAQFLQAWNAAAPASAQVAVPDAAGLARGLPWLALGKTTLFGEVGARYVAVKESFDLFAALGALDGAPSPYAPAQRQWLEQALLDSDARFKVVASSVSFTSLVLDLSRPELQAPEPMRRRFYLNLDQWDGFPAERRRLIDQVFDRAGGVIVLSGDIHAGFATQHSAATVEFTTPAVSSETLGSILARSGQGEDAQAQATARVAAALDALVIDGNRSLRYAQTRRHGVGLLRLDGEHAQARFLELPDSVCRQRHYQAPEAIGSQLTEKRFTFARADMRLREA
jgi:alkaline phosphatase D